MSRPDIKDINIRICELPLETRDKIKKDLERFAELNNLELETDKVSGEYLALSAKFSEIEELYV